MNKILLQQKNEKKQILTGDYAKREALLYAKKNFDNKLIKVILGPRRAGKSIFSFLLLKGKEFAYINFDDEEILKITNYDEIIKGLYEIYKDVKIIFFDEIQNVPDWEILVNKLQRRGYNLVLTGSNAHLLSKDLATVLTGRHLAIEVLPFSFKEFLNVKNIDIDLKSFENIPEIRGKILNLLLEYLQSGGFPEIVIEQHIDKKKYIETLFDAVLFKDVVKRYEIKQSNKLYELALYMISNFAKEFTFNRIKNVLGFNSIVTLKRYMQYLEDTYIFFELKRFSFKMTEQIKTARKLYCVDNGFILAKAFQFSENKGRLMENVVFVDLMRKGYNSETDLFYYKTKNDREIDFVLRKGLKIDTLIQVCYDLNEETQEREIKALIEAGDELRCDSLVIITWDDDRVKKYKGKKIKLIPLWKWLLMKGFQK